VTKPSDKARRVIEGPNLALLADLMGGGLAAREPGLDRARERVGIRGRIEGEEADRQIDELARTCEGVDEDPWRKEGERCVMVLVEPLVVSQ
jgi:hypothetical protein